jgi:Cdc6-like AAA superfamily ATPase
MQQQSHDRFTTVREQLGLAVPKELPGREEEVKKLYERLTQCVTSLTSITMYIAGEPGTGICSISIHNKYIYTNIYISGKTATVKTVLAQLVSDHENEVINCPGFHICFVNAMSLPSPKDIYAQVWKIVGKHTKKKVSKRDQPKAVQKFILAPNAQKKYTIIVIDELDFANTKEQDVIYQFMDWPQKGGSRLAVIGISNTVNFPEQLKEKIANRMQTTERIIFKTYTPQQIEEILRKRLAGSDVFDEKALKIVAHRIASSSGDIRRGLDICRRAAEMKEEKITIEDESPATEDVTMEEEEPEIKVISRRGMKRKRRVSLSQKSQQRLETEKVTLEDVNKAFEEIVSTELYPISYLPIYQKLFMWCARLEAQEQTGELKSENIISRVQTLLRKNNKVTSEVTIYEMLPVIDCLAGMGFFSIKSDKDRYPLIELQISNEDIGRALEQDEEVKLMTVL